MSQFDNVIFEFQQKRLEKEIATQKIKSERLQQLYEQAMLADLEMRQRKSRRNTNYSAY